MAQQVVNIGTVANDGTGDPLRDAFDKINDNFVELYGTSLSARGDWSGTSAFPTTGGSGISGAVVRGNRWRLTGTLSVGGNVYPPGSIIEAAIDSPGATTRTDWIIYAQQL